MIPAAPAAPVVLAVPAVPAAPAVPVAPAVPPPGGPGCTGGPIVSGGLAGSKKIVQRQRSGEVRAAPLIILIKGYPDFILVL